MGRLSWIVLVDQIELEEFLKGTEGDGRVRQNVRVEAEIGMMRLSEGATRQGMWTASGIWKRQGSGLFSRDFRRNAGLLIS